MYNDYTFKDLEILYIYKELDPETELNVSQLLKENNSVKNEFDELLAITNSLRCLNASVNPATVNNILNFSRKLNNLQTH